MSSEPQSDSRTTNLAWAKWFYALVGISLVPWIVHLQYTLPDQQIAQNWRTMWIGFDIILLTLIMTSAYLLHKRSQWASLVLTSLGTLFLADAWFDIFMANGSSEVTAAIMMAAPEIPLAILSFWCAVRTHIDNK